MIIGLKLSSPATGIYPISDNSNNFITQTTLLTALETAPSNEAVASENDTAEIQEEATVTRTWQLKSGKYCREYTYVIKKSDGSRTTEHGAACRSEEGKWKAKLKLYPSGKEI